MVPLRLKPAGEEAAPLSFAPHPGRPVRELFSDDVIAADLARLAAQQQPDGGWLVDFASYSPEGERQVGATTPARPQQVGIACHLSRVSHVRITAVENCPTGTRGHGLNSHTGGAGVAAGTFSCRRRRGGDIGTGEWRKTGGAGLGLSRVRATRANRARVNAS